MRYPRALPVGIFLLVSAITALSVYAIEQVESQRTEAQHRQMASAASSAIVQLVDANSVYLRAGSLLSTSRPDFGEAFEISPANSIPIAACAPAARWASPPFCRAPRSRSLKRGCTPRGCRGTPSIPVRSAPPRSCR